VNAFRIRFTFDRAGVAAFAGGSPPDVTDEKLNGTRENPDDTRVKAFHTGVTAFPDRRTPDVASPRRSD
jgi:hypothetical protein